MTNNQFAPNAKLSAQVPTDLNLSFGQQLSLEEQRGFTPFKKTDTQSAGESPSADVPLAQADQLWLALHHINSSNCFRDKTEFKVSNEPKDDTRVGHSLAIENLLSERKRFAAQIPDALPINKSQENSRSE